MFMDFFMFCICMFVKLLKIQFHVHNYRYANWRLYCYHDIFVYEFSFWNVSNILQKQIQVDTLPNSIHYCNNV